MLASHSLQLRLLPLRTAAAERQNNMHASSTNSSTQQAAAAVLPPAAHAAAAAALAATAAAAFQLLRSPAAGRVLPLLLLPLPLQAPAVLAMLALDAQPAALRLPYGVVAAGS
jgi:hypothetical protein